MVKFKGSEKIQNASIVVTFKHPKLLLSFINVDNMTLVLNKLWRMSTDILNHMTKQENKQTNKAYFEMYKNTRYTEEVNKQTLTERRQTNYVDQEYR